jgi:hypothetical protein
MTARLGPQMELVTSLIEAHALAATRSMLGVY